MSEPKFTRVQRDKVYVVTWIDRGKVRVRTFSNEAKAKQWTLSMAQPQHQQIVGRWLQIFGTEKEVVDA